MSCDMEKMTWELIRTSINKGHYPRQRKKFFEIQNFFKTSTSSKEAISKVLKPSSPTRSSIGLTLNALWEFFNNTLKTNQKYFSKYQIIKSRSTIHV